MSSESPYGRAALIVGPESLLAERATAELIHHARAADPTATTTRLVGGHLDRGSLAEASGGSLFASSSVVIIDQAADVPPDLFAELTALAAAPYPDLALAIVHNGGAKAKALLDRLRPVCSSVVECPAVKPWELPQFVSAEVRRARRTIDPRTAALLVDAVGSDLRALTAAVAQLIADTGDGPVDEALVRRYFGGRAEVSSFAVADDVLAGNVGGALGKLRWALSTGVVPVLVTSALAASLRNLGKYLDARDSRVRDADLAKTVGVPPFKLKDLARQSRDWTPGGVARSLQAVALADAAIKGAASDPGFALEQAVLGVIRQRGRQVAGTRR